MWHHGFAHGCYIAVVSCYGDIASHVNAPSVRYIYSNSEPYLKSAMGTFSKLNIHFSS